MIFSFILDLFILNILIDYIFPLYYLDKLLPIRNLYIDRYSFNIINADIVTINIKKWMNFLIPCSY